MWARPPSWHAAPDCRPRFAQEPPAARPVAFSFPEAGVAACLPAADHPADEDQRQAQQYQVTQGQQPGHIFPVRAQAGAVLPAVGQCQPRADRNAHQSQLGAGKEQRVDQPALRKQAERDDQHDEYQQRYGANEQEGDRVFGKLAHDAGRRPELHCVSSPGNPVAKNSTPWSMPCFRASLHP